MKKFTLFIFAFFLHIALFAQSFEFSYNPSAGAVQGVQVIESAGKSQDELFNEGMDWFSGLVNNPAQSLIYENRNSGKFKGIFISDIKFMYGKLAFKHEIEFEARDGRCRVVITPGNCVENGLAFTDYTIKNGELRTNKTYINMYEDGKLVTEAVMNRFVKKINTHDSQDW